MRTCISVVYVTRNGNSSKKEHSKLENTGLHFVLFIKTKNLLISICSNLLLSANFLCVPQTLTSFRVSWQYFLTLLNLMNYQPSSEVNDSRPFVPLMTLVVSNTHMLTPGKHPQYL